MAEVKAGRRRSTSAPAAGELRIGLFDAGMTALHRAGLAGLWQTLQRIDERPEHAALRTTLRELASWSLDEQGVTFAWADADRATTFFETLIQSAFQVTADGRISLLGRGAPSEFKDQGITLHDALLATFLQHGRTRGADPSGKPTGVVVVSGHGAEQVFPYRKVSWYQHQRARVKLDAPNEIVGWQYPGAAVRHDAFKRESQLFEPAGPWLALLFAPAGALYFRVQRWSAGIRPQFSLVAPEIDDLRAYAEVCTELRQASVRDLVVNGSAEAALRAMAALEGSAAAKDPGVSGCLVMTYGVVPWSNRQKTRIDLFEASRVTPTGLRVYRKAHQLLPPIRVVAGGDAGRSRGDGEEEAVGRPRFETSPVPDLVARNVAEGRVWWKGFAEVVGSQERFGQLLAYQAAARVAAGRTGPTGVRQMVLDTVLSDTGDGQRPEAVIVLACHTAWRRRMGRLWEQAGGNQRAFNDLVSRERERLRVDFNRCKNAATLRATLTDFWARADGPIKALQEDWRAVLPFLTEERWQEGRDLALLALVSYAAPEERSDGDGEDE